MTDAEITSVAPNLSEKIFVWRPIYADPPLCTLGELRTIYDLNDLHDFHEVLDMRDALAAKVATTEDKD